MLENTGKNPGFIQEKYKLGESSGAARAAVRTKQLTGREIAPHRKDLLAQNYLDRLSTLIDPNNPRAERNIEMLKRRLYEKVIISPNNPAFSINSEIAKTGKSVDASGKPYKLSAIDKQILQLWERGQGGDLEQADLRTLQEQFVEATIADQKSSLDGWVDYFSSSDAPYPDWLKYWAFRSVLQMSTYDKERKAFGNRSSDTTKPFPELNREALSYVLDALEKKYTGQQSDLTFLEFADRQKFEQLLAGENFSKLYAWAIEKVTPDSQELFANTQGVWVKFPKNSDPMAYRPMVQVANKRYEGQALVPSIQGHGTGWCTAGESTARAQLQGGDFYVYYSFDRSGNPTIPRVAIRMEGDRIGEVRGVAEQQNLDSYISPVVARKLNDPREFPDGQSYQKRVADMQYLTSMYQRAKAGQALGRDDLRFLYELDGQIEGFGYQTDPRIAELRSDRTVSKDAATIFGEPIAHEGSPINRETKAYIGRLTPGILQELKRYKVEYVYTAFPDGKVNFFDPLKIEQIQTPGRLLSELKKPEKNIQISSYAESMMLNQDFAMSQFTGQLDLVRLRVQDLGLSGDPTIDEIYRKAADLGLDLCPPEVGPYLRLQYADQPQGDWTYIAMNQIAGSDGHRYVFGLGHDVGRLWLNDGWAGPGSKWGPESRFLFRLRKA